MTNLSKLLSCLAVIACAGCQDPPRVAQGKVVSVDQAAHLLVMDDERPPNSRLTLDIASAELGGAPAAGDVVRVAYHDAAGQLKAGRVMCVTCAAAAQPGGGGH